MRIMRKSIHYLLLLALLAAGCVDDIIAFDDVEFPQTSTGTDSTDSSSSSSDDSSGSNSNGIEAVVDNTDDYVANTTFDRTITITFAAGGASVEGDDLGFVTVDGNNVTVNNSGTDVIQYKLTGSASSGYFKLYSTKKQAILLSDLTLTNPDGAAINNQSGKRTFVMVEGSNTLSDGGSAAYGTEGDEDMKAVLFSEGQLVFSGSGALTVNAINKQGKSGIVSDDYVRVMDAQAVLSRSPPPLQ